jgi:hypothetical protein
MHAVRRSIQYICICLAAAFSNCAFADYVVNRIDYIDAVTGARAPYTVLWATNNNGQTLGNASLDQQTFFNFVYDPATGNFTVIPQPDGFDGVIVSATAIGMNDSGAITGSTFDFNTFIAGGFVLADGVYKFFSAPAWADTNPRTIGNASAAHAQGLVVGYVDDGIFATTDSTSAFVYDPATGAFATLNGTNSFDTFGHGQNSAGQITGHIFSDGSGRLQGYWGFVFTPSTANDPLLGGSTAYFRVNGLPTRARGINDKGTIVGFVRNPSTLGNLTFVGTLAGFEFIDFPDANTGPVCPSGFRPGAAADHINNAGQITGQLTDNSCNARGFIATPVSRPTGTTPGGAFTFNVNVTAGEPTFINLPVALAYDYAVGHDDPRFAAVRLPLGIGDNKFVLVVGDRAYPLNAGQLFDFRAHGFTKGVKHFRVACIDPAAMLDAGNAAAFPTQLVFTDSGTFTGTQKPLANATGRDDDAGGVPGQPMTQDECRQRLLSLRGAGGENAD